jgi:hypothetical protein
VLMVDCRSTTTMNQVDAMEVACVLWLCVCATAAFFYVPVCAGPLM